MVPEKIVAVTIHKGMSVLGTYNHNVNWKQTYTPNAMKYKVCINNPKQFKKCTEAEFRHIKAETILYFPALPEPKISKTIKWVYTHNEIYRLMFPSFTTFQQEVCKNNSGIKAKCATKAIITEETKITSRPETYLIPDATAHSIISDNNTFTKAEKGGYYRLTQTPVVIKLPTTGTKTELNTQFIFPKQQPGDIEIPQNPTQESLGQVTQKTFITKPPDRSGK